MTKRAIGKNHAERAAPYRTLHGWAVGVLLETHAIAECPDHGHIRDRGSWAHGWDEARLIATTLPFKDATPEQALAAIDDVMRSVGDACPEC